MICDFCEKDKPDVEVYHDLFYEKITGKEEKKYLCKECYENLD